jgi:hypothetical protein
LDPLGIIGWGVKWILEKVFRWVPQAIRKHTYVPEIDVRVQLSETPYFPNRPDIKSIVFSLTSIRGITKVVKGHVRFYNPDDPADGEEKHISATQMLESRREDFSLPFIKITFASRVMNGEARLEAECNLTLQRPNGETHQQDKRYIYNSRKKIFEEVQG